jgi:hypothetical protein
MAEGGDKGKGRGIAHRSSHPGHSALVAGEGLVIPLPIQGKTLWDFFSFAALLHWDNFLKAQLFVRDFLGLSCIKDIFLPLIYDKKL